MFLIIVLINLESNWLKVQQRGVPGTREILEGLIEKVDIPDQKIILADLTMNKLLGAIKRHLLLFIQLEVGKKTMDFQWSYSCSEEFDLFFLASILQTNVGS